MMEQVVAIFSIFMVFFYLGVGVYLAFYFNRTYMDRALCVIMGVTFIFYGLFRAYRTYVKTTELFFPKGKEEE